MTKLHFTAATDATQALDAMRARHDDAGPEAADIVIALGGDGFMLQTLHTFTDKGKPIYGMNLGSVGFLMNEYRQEDLLKRLAAAEKAEIHPLIMQAHTAKGITEARAFNEVSLLRQNGLFNQALTPVYLTCMNSAPSRAVRVLASALSFMHLEIEPCLYLSLVGSVMQKGGARSPTAAQATRPIASRDR